MAVSCGPDSRRSPPRALPEGFELTTAAHRFLLAVLPWRHPASEEALSVFVNAARACTLSPLHVEAILLRVLAVLNKHAKGRLPTLVDRYLSLESTHACAVDGFRSCVMEVFAWRGFGDRYVERAIAIIEADYGDPSLKERLIAEKVHLRPAALCTRFNRRTGMTVMAYLRGVRLDRAATLLVTTDLTIKEVWAAVGYSDFSNFDHDFKGRFGMKPSEYRARGVPPACRTDDPLPPGRETRPQSPEPSAPRGAVLIVDDDEGTRETIGRYLRVQGYAVTAVATAEDALRRAAARRPDAVLLDYHLPGMDGLTCLRSLRAQRSGQPPRVVLFSADWELEARVGELRALDATLASKLLDLEQVESLLFPA